MVRRICSEYLADTWPNALRFSARTTSPILGAGTFDPAAPRQPGWPDRPHHHCSGDLGLCHLRRTQENENLA